MEDADRQMAILLQKQFDMEIEIPHDNFINESEKSFIGSSVDKQEASSSRFKTGMPIKRPVNDIIFNNKKRKYDDNDILKSQNDSSSDVQMAILLQQQLDREIQIEKNKSSDESDKKMAILLQKQFDMEMKRQGSCLANETEIKSLNDSPDKQMAVLLQQQFDMEVQLERPSNNLIYDDKKKKYQNLDKSKSLVDPSWELVDPTPNIHVLFMAFNQRFFWNKLLAVTVSWSKRMTTCAGICSYQGRSGLCQITLSEPLLKLRPRKDLVETLLHEMIHGYLFITNNDRDRDGHGPKFHEHMYRINNEAGTNITVYHDFHDEVKLYKQHWWRCDGLCQHRRPFYGYVKRAMNRAPGPNDFWWAEHQKTCGGKFIKIKEPEKPKKETKADVKAKEIKKNTNDIRNFFPDKNNIKTNTNMSTVKKNINNVKTINDIKNGTCNGLETKNKNGTGNGLETKNKNGTVVLPPKVSKNNNLQNKENLPKYNSKIVTLNDIKSEKNKQPIKTNDSIVNNQNDKSTKNHDYSVVRNHWLSKFDNINKKSKNNDIQINKKIEDNKICKKIEYDNKQNLSFKRQNDTEDMYGKKCFGFIQVTSVELEESSLKSNSLYDESFSDLNYLPSEIFFNKRTLTDSCSNIDACSQTINHVNSLDLIPKHYSSCSSNSNESVIPKSIDVEIQKSNRNDNNKPNFESCNKKNKSCQSIDIDKYNFYFNKPACEPCCKTIQTESRQCCNCDIQTEEIINSEGLKENPTPFESSEYQVNVQEEVLEDIIDKIKCEIYSVKSKNDVKYNDLCDDSDCTSNNAPCKPDIPNLIQCNICNNRIKAENYDLHMSQCLNKMYSDIENKYNLKTECEQKNKDLITCCYCNEVFCKKDLHNHLQNCIGTVFDNLLESETVDTCQKKNKNKKQKNKQNIKQTNKHNKKPKNSDTEEESDLELVETDESSMEKKYNCPICTVPLSLKDMNKHIEECVGDNL